MPELPDLQVFSANLTKVFGKRKLKSLEIRNATSLKDPVAKLKKAAEGKKLNKVYRSGKELRFDFGNVILGLHLMLHGNMYITGKSNEVKHLIAEFHFDNDKTLVISDWQGKANIKLDPVDKKGVDALSPELTVKYLQEKMRSKAAIKNLITDQDVIRGIGNAYADEILWYAGISPFSISNKIPQNKIKELVKQIKKVLKDAEKQIKKKEPDLITGEVRDFLVIHHPKKKESPAGGKILTKNVGGRRTYYTEEQEVYE